MYNVCVDGREITHWKGTLLVANRLDALRVFSGATSSELVKRGGKQLATTRTQRSLSLPDKGFLTFRIHLAVTYQFHRNDCYLVSQTESVFFTKKSKAPDSSPYSSQRKMIARLGGNYRIFFLVSTVLDLAIILSIVPSKNSNLGGVYRIFFFC
jgi:hypothetical protein